MDSLQLIETESTHSTDESVENFGSFAFQVLTSLQSEKKSTKKTQVVGVMLSCVLFKRETIDCAVSRQLLEMIA